MSLSIDSTHTLQNVLNTTFYIEAVKPMSILEVSYAEETVEVNLVN